MDRLEELREKIRAIDPRFTDELIDLLCDCVFVKKLNVMQASIEEGED